MKRLILTTVIVAMLLCSFPVRGYSSEIINDIIVFEDGSYITIKISEVDTRATLSKSVTKTYTYYGSDGAADWKAVLSGSFAYNGFTSTCAVSSCDVTVYDSVWYVISKSAGKSGNTATGEVTMGRDLLGVTVDTRTINLTLSCDINGNLS